MTEPNTMKQKANYLHRCKHTDLLQPKIFLLPFWNYSADSVKHGLEPEQYYSCRDIREKYMRMVYKHARTPSQSYKRKCVAYQYSLDNLTLWLQAGDAGDDFNHILSGPDHVACECKKKKHARKYPNKTGHCQKLLKVSLHWPEFKHLQDELHPCTFLAKKTWSQVNDAIMDIESHNTSKLLSTHCVVSWV